MALSSDTLKNEIIKELKALGFVVEGKHSRNAELAEAIAKAVVTVITRDAIVPVTKGSSAGTYQVK